MAQEMKMVRVLVQVPGLVLEPVRAQVPAQVLVPVV